jgi:FlaA1/EpsC-like NDP-sugar epimerase
MFIGLFRLSKRLYVEVLQRPSNVEKHAVIFGAGNSGEQILREIKRNPEWGIEVDGLFDDDSNLHGLRLHGVQVSGDREALYEYLNYSLASQLIIAAPSMAKQKVRDLVEHVKEVQPDIQIKILPSFHRITDEAIGYKQLRDIRLEDVLGRDAVDLDTDAIDRDVHGKTVLVTGGAGSIGSEIVRQVLKFEPTQVLAVDIDETELFYLQRELSDQYADQMTPVVADVTDASKLRRILEEHRPEVIYHAAAYKHVPMMEKYPDEAIRVNIGGTRNLAELADQYGVEKMVMISTDKAVNPTSVMGATKRVAEQICLFLNEESDTQYISVRFGNVLGSRGSVVPIFMEQIQNGGPITVTHEDMKRYFMTIPEAVLLVMQAGANGQGGEVFVLDMGEPVKIMDLAKELIRMQDLEPNVDIPIEITGLRPGEKLYEELLTAEEGVDSTRHEQIFKARGLTIMDYDSTVGRIEQLMHLLASNNGGQRRIRLKQELKKLVPSFHNPNDQEFAAMETKDANQAEPQPAEMVAQ